jgi:DNA/RNA-binding protein KIN17
LNFGKKARSSQTGKVSTAGHDPQEDATPSAGLADTPKPIIPVYESGSKEETQEPNVDTKQEGPLPTTEAPSAPAKVSLKMGIQSKPKNVFAATKKNALAGKKVAVIEQPKKMSEAERIMKEEMERKRRREASGSGDSGQKRQKFRERFLNSGFWNGVRNDTRSGTVQHGVNDTRYI